MNRFRVELEGDGCRRRGHGRDQPPSSRGGPTRPAGAKRPPRCRSAPARPASVAASGAGPPGAATQCTLAPAVSASGSGSHAAHRRHTVTVTPSPLPGPAPAAAARLPSESRVTRYYPVSELPCHRDSGPRISRGSPGSLGSAPRLTNESGAADWAPDSRNPGPGSSLPVASSVTLVAS